MELPEELAAVGDRCEPDVGALRRLHEVENLQIQAVGDCREAAVANLEPLEVDLRQPGDATRRDSLQKPVPVAGAPVELQAPEVLRADDERPEALTVVQLLQADGPERGGGGAGADRLGGGAIGESAEPLDGELLERGGFVEDGVDSSSAEGARAARELLQAPAIPADRRHADVGDLPAVPELKPGEIPAPDGDQHQRIVSDTDGFPIAFESKLRNRVESGEDGRDRGHEIGSRIEGDAVAALPLDDEPPPADERALLPVAGAEGLEDDRQALVRQIGDEVAAEDGIQVVSVVGEGGEVAARICGRRGDRGRRFVHHPTAAVEAGAFAAIESRRIADRGDGLAHLGQKIFLFSLRSFSLILSCSPLQVAGFLV